MTNPRKNDYSSITGRCFINVPFDHLEQGMLDLFLTHGLQPEIGLEGNCLWTTPTETFAQVAARFADHGLACTLHAPFFDLMPGALDPKIREVTREKLRRAFAPIRVFQPRSMVCHLGYDNDKHTYKMKEWLDFSVETWSELLAVAEESGTPVMFENTYEPLPDIHQRLFELLPGNNFGFCLDVGHLMAFAGSPWQLWMKTLQPWLGQVHLHDNDGSRDDHIAIGRGRFNFSELFEYLRRNNLSPIITLEPHSEKDLWDSLESIRTLDLFGGKQG